MTNDEVQMTKENRITNCRKHLGEGEVDPAEDMFWGGADQAGAFELHDGTDDGKRVFDLEERTAQFGEAILQFAKKIPQSPVNNRLIGQLFGAGTSVGASSFVILKL